MNNLTTDQTLLIGADLMVLTPMVPTGANDLSGRPLWEPWFEQRIFIDGLDRAVRYANVAQAESSTPFLLAACNVPITQEVIDGLNRTAAQEPIPGWPKLGGHWQPGTMLLWKLAPVDDPGAETSFHLSLSDALRWSWPLALAGSMWRIERVRTHQDSAEFRLAEFLYELEMLTE